MQSMFAKVKFATYYIMCYFDPPLNEVEGFVGCIEAFQDLCTLKGITFV